MCSKYTNKGGQQFKNIVLKGSCFIEKLCLNAALSFFTAVRLNSWFEACVSVFELLPRRAHSNSLYQGKGIKQMGLHQIHSLQEVTMRWLTREQTFTNAKACQTKFVLLSFKIIFLSRISMGTFSKSTAWWEKLLMGETRERRKATQTLRIRQK